MHKNGLDQTVADSGALLVVSSLVLLLPCFLAGLVDVVLGWVARALENEEEPTTEVEKEGFAHLDEVGHNTGQVIRGKTRSLVNMAREALRPFGLFLHFGVEIRAHQLMQQSCE